MFIQIIPICDETIDITPASVLGDETIEILHQNNILKI